MKNKVILLLSLPLAALIVIVSCVGLLTPGFYSAETLNWQAQSVGQDMVDLFLVTPGLLISSILSYRGNKTATTAWGGVMLYLSYTFILYCFDVHFNKLFILYCFCLGLAFYSLIYFLFIEYRTNAYRYSEKKPVVRLVGIYFIIISILFYFLWLSEILPSIIHQTIPKSVVDTGLLTNGVHVLDLSIFLPAIFMTGVFLLRKVSIGFILAPMLLTFFVLMDFTIGVLAFVMNFKGVEGDLTLTVIMGVLALFSLSLFIWYHRSIKPLLVK